MKGKIIHAHENGDGTYTYAVETKGMSIILGKCLPPPMLSSDQLDKLFDESLALYEAGIKEGRRQEAAAYAQAARRIGDFIADILDGVKRN